MRFLVTGSAGFIGFHVARRLLAEGHTVVGLDGMTAYYDVSLKRRRHGVLNQMPRFSAAETMLEDVAALDRVWTEAQADVVIHLAAQPGVRYSLENPRAYIDANVIGTFNVLEAARRAPPRHLLLASTSSVYGGNETQPFREADKADHPMTFYAATKKATEDIAHAYSHLFGVPTTAFRFFTVYGPWGRPDMAIYKFTQGIAEGTPIDVYGRGKMARDFTYVDDIVEGIVRLIGVVPARSGEAIEGDSLSPVAPYRVVNIGAGRPVPLEDFIAAIERATGRSAIRRDLPMQPGEVVETFASTELLRRLTGFEPEISVQEGVRRFVEWYRAYHATA